MNRKHRYSTGWEVPRRWKSNSSEDVKPVEDVERVMTSTFARALELRSTTVQIVAHSQRVTALVAAVGDLVEVRGAEQERLQLAAQLHEIGMVGVPPDLLTRRGSLSPAELDSVRTHARVGAEMVRVSHGPATARLIERQYDDYRYLRRSVLDSRELLLAGILRIADVYDAMVAPRPYQEPVPESRLRQVLRIGSGTKFHPAAVFALLHLIGENPPERPVLMDPTPRPH